MGKEELYMQGIKTGEVIEFIGIQELSLAVYCQCIGHL